MEAREFFRKYEIAKSDDIGSCKDCVFLLNFKCGELFDGCPIPPLYYFKKKNEI